MDIVSGKKGAVYIIGDMYRLGFSTLMCEIEHRFYPPDTLLNEGYNIFLITYGMITFVVMELDCPDMKAVEEVAYGLNLKLVNGKPYNNKREFPVLCGADQCFVVEGLPEDIIDIKDDLKKELETLREKYPHKDQHDD
jgi:hypothetical protein